MSAERWFRRLLRVLPGDFRAGYGAEMTLPAHAATAVRFALETPDFRVGDLPGGLDDSGKGVLVKRLIREGMVRRLT